MFVILSLSSLLAQGSDLTNQLIGVLCRFRQDPVAFTCDVESMFHQFRVATEYRNFLRFFWWPDSDSTKPPIEYRMTVHLFGAASSPGCANYGLKRIAHDHEKEFGSDAANFVKYDFYVDDGLKSVGTAEHAISLVEKTKQLCAKGGLRLHKFVSNSKKVIAAIPPEDRSSQLKDLDLGRDPLPLERALGVQWCVESDSFQLRIIVQDNPLTRRGILSTVCYVYDPLGFVSPVVLIAKQILQELCRDGADWDDSVPESIRCRWERWRNDLYLLNEVKVQRCFKPSGFEELKSVELHHFSDASTSGYGQCSYVRLVNQNDEVHCALVMGKSRVTPLKSITIPRLELTAAQVSVKVSNTIHRELQYDKVTDIYWTDSKVVLGYLSNESRRFHVFVANRVQQIRDETSSEQWQYVESKRNPADDASRGLTAREFLANQRWLSEPQFLWNLELDLATENNHPILDDDPEVKAFVFLTQTAPSKPFTIAERLEYFSDWHRAKRAISVILRYQRRWRASRSRSDEESAPPAASNGTLTVEDLHQAKLVIVLAVQQESFGKEIQALRPLKEPSSRSDAQNRKREMKKTSSLYRLDPFLDEKGVLRVGGRLTHASTPYHVKHPMILPRKGHLTPLIIRHYHHKINHQGRGMTMNALRANGFWITGESSAVTRYIADCVTCQKLHGPTQEQKMADLPKDRIEPSPPFTFCGVDYFGPWRIKEGRRELKRYGVIFTCLVSRAIHLQVAASLETDSWKLAIRSRNYPRGSAK